MPDYLPIIGGDLVSQAPLIGSGSVLLSTPGDTDNEADLITLMARTLLAVAVIHDRQSRIPLALAANVCHLLLEGPLAVRGLPHLSGISREAVAMSLGSLKRKLLIEEFRDAGQPRTPLVRLTPEGKRMTIRHAAVLDRVEAEVLARVGEATAAILRQQLEAMAGDGSRDSSRLFAGLTPYRTAGDRRESSLLFCPGSRWYFIEAAIPTEVSNWADVSVDPHRRHPVLNFDAQPNGDCLLQFQPF